LRVSETAVARLSSGFLTGSIPHKPTADLDRGDRLGGEQL
jgi:hypothetical protein